MISLPIPTPSCRLLQARFQILSLVAGLMLAVSGALAMESAEDASQPVARHRGAATTPHPIAIPKAPVTIYYIVTSAPSRVVPEEAVDIEQGWIPSNIFLHFRVVDSPESETHFLDEVNWQVLNDRPHRVFDMR